MLANAVAHSVSFPSRTAKTTKLFKAPEFYPNCLAIPDKGDPGIWIVW